MLAIIRGAGDIATAIALRLWRSGISVVMTEIEQPLTVRRTVAFSEAVRLGQAQVEGVLAICVQDVRQAREVLERKHAIPVLIDPECRCIELKPDVVVDAILAKRNLGTSMDMAPVVVGVGPGFTAGKDCHAVVETMRGHTLGRAYYQGSALPNTAVPGLVGGFAGERVLRFCVRLPMACFVVFVRLAIMSKRAKPLLMLETLLWWLCLREFYGVCWPMAFVFLKV